MKMKHILLLGAPPFILAFCFLEWHVADLSSENERHEMRQATKGKTDIGLKRPTAMSMLNSPANMDTMTETPEMKNARIMAQARSGFAKVSPIIDAYNSGGVAGVLRGRMDRMKSEYLAFLQSLGLSEELSEDVFQMLKVESELAVSNMSEKRASMQRGEGTQGEPFQAGREVLTKLKEAVGTENYEKIKYWQLTQQEREKTQALKLELASQAVNLSAQKEAVVIDALYQARQGNPWFALNNPHASTQEKITFVNDVRARLVPSLSKVELDLLTEYLTQVAEKPLLSPNLLNQLSKGAK
jgi:hypothetical protein